MDIECNGIPVMNYAKPWNGAVCGHFTGRLAMRLDMRRPFGIAGTLTFLDGMQDDSLRLKDLCVDMRADGQRIFCLFNDLEWSKTHE